jgi:trans-aconitate methyltransferase
MTGDAAAAADGKVRGADKFGPLPFDTSVAHQARIYDYLLDGKDNYAADRAAAEAWLKIYPDLLFTARANRAFLGRVARYLTEEAGIRQFLDIGAGIPTAGNLHEVVQAIAPESRVVYVDYDPVVLAHARALLASSEEGATAYIDADIRDTGAVLDRAAELLDFTKPVAVLALAVLHALPDAEDPYAVVARLMDAVPPGSYLAVSHMGGDLLDAETLHEAENIGDRMVQQQLTFRSRDQVTRFFEGTDLLAPGLVWVEEWRPEPSGTGETGRSSQWGGLGRKR